MATPGERRLWAQLSKRQLTGCKLSRQMPIGPYFADFLCREKKLVIEIDGYSHDMQRDHDVRRNAFLSERGFKVLQFTNADVFERLEGVVATIERTLDEPPYPHPQPLPQAGGEF